MSDRRNRLVVLGGRAGDIEIVETGLTAPAAGELVARVEMAGVCGTDVHFWTGHTEHPAPMVLGHEGVGVIEELGAGARTDYASRPVSIGDRIVWAPERPCHRCYSCVVRGDTSVCESPEAYCSPGEGNWATYADYALLPSDMAFFRAAARTPPAALAAFGCALPTVLQAFERAGGVSPGANVVVQGSGPVGLAATFLARIAGADRVLVIGRPAHRLSAAAKLGADQVIDITDIKAESDRRAIVLEATGGRGADLVVEATGVLGAMEEGVGLLAPSGRYLVIGLWGTPGEVSVAPRVINNQNHSVIGSSLCQARHYYQAVRLVERHHPVLPLADMVSHRFPLEDAAAALAASRAEETIKAVIVPGG